MAEWQPDQELLKRSLGTCLIIVPSSCEGIVRFLCCSGTGCSGLQGTGFHFGGGWVMSVAHNFQNDETDDKTTHSLLSRATFQFDMGTETFRFPPPAYQGNNCRPTRMAFIHHLIPGENVDFQNMDIAMVKLGRQYDYGERPDLTDWEKAEQEQLEEMIKCFPDFLVSIASLNTTETQQGDAVYIIHRGGDDGEKKYVPGTVLAINNAQVNGLATLKVSPASLQGASGSPILNDQYHLVGLLFAGSANVTDPQATDFALKWAGGIQEYINKGVQIVTNIGTYMSYSRMARQAGSFQASFEQTALETREELTLEARQSSLTVYLMNGDVFK